MLNNPDNLENMVDDDVTVTNDEASFANLAGESLTSLVEIVPFTRDQVRKYSTIWYFWRGLPFWLTLGTFQMIIDYNNVWLTVTNDKASFANLAGESLTSLVEIVPFTRDQVRFF